ncbi:hypothetical protein CAEBREN_19526 [Caenorhabditis brenneri]|uniref:histone acetyltransferase n=1 Tax=Caenorhabditis brenneri TaxID=135651 RepID=G0P2H2_CAEBE|nr:hypothetical protein CAEBREN_19526 [Caenorhabditis brenneri]
MACVSSSSSSGNKNVNIPKVNKAVRNGAPVPSRPNATANQNTGTSKKEVAWERVSKRLQRTHSATGHLKDTPLSQLMQKNLDDLFEGTRHNLTVKEVYSKELLYSETEDGREAKQMLQRHGIQFIDYSFRYRMICVFQKHDGEEVLFFCMSVKEYRAQKWCTIDYLDSVSLYSGVVFRTKVYEELIYSYFEFARSIGYERVHIFVAALGENKEYFFHKRPTTMRLPEQPMLMTAGNMEDFAGNTQVLAAVETLLLSSLSEASKVGDSLVGFAPEIFKLSCLREAFSGLAGLSFRLLELFQLFGLCTELPTSCFGLEDFSPNITRRLSKFIELIGLF